MSYIKCPMFKDYDQFHIDNPPICGVCNRDLIETSNSQKIAYAKTTDFDCVCEACWPHFVTASLLLDRVLGSQVAKGKRQK
jgi:hypothetical protein